MNENTDTLQTTLRRIAAGLRANNLDFQAMAVEDSIAALRAAETRIDALETIIRNGQSHHFAAGSL